MSTHEHASNQHPHYDDDDCSNPHVTKPIDEVIAARFSRRTALKGLAAVATGSLLGPLWPQRPAAALPTGPGTTLTFDEIPLAADGALHVAPGYRCDVLMRWGDPVLPDAPTFDVQHQTPDAQARQFGYNCDYIGLVPLPRGATDASRALLCVNHEYTDTHLMFPGIDRMDSLANLTREQVEIELAAHGHSVVEIERVAGQCRAVPGSHYNRRITALDTPMRISGPAAGHERMKTSEDLTGRRVIGTLNNCAGGITPWGTVLTCEENFDVYFTGDGSGTSEARNHARYGLAAKSKFRPAFARHFRRFDVAREPHEPNRFGWMVEFNPYDPQSTPVKRTALGRLKHEGAGIVVSHDGRVAIYAGDDQQFDYVYRFVTREAYDPQQHGADNALLDEGTLSVARFNDDGTLQWLPLVYGQGPLTSENEFYSQADVLIESRRAADLLGATPMDRPEEVEVCPTTGHVFVMLTGSPKRKESQVDAANPRPANVHGHILELVPPAADARTDHTAARYTWNVFLRCGDPAKAEDAASYPPGVSPQGWLSRPDNAAFDGKGRLWIATDGAPETVGKPDGIFACDTTGPGRGLTRQFMLGPRGAEVSGIVLTADDRALLVSVQHPGEDEGSTFEHPSSRWPDFDPAMPPRPSVVTISRVDGGPIGS